MSADHRWALVAIVLIALFIWLSRSGGGPAEYQPDCTFAVGRIC